MYPQRSVMTCGLATALEPPHFNHAPVRGAIGASFSRRSRAGSFNPRTRVATGGRAAAWLSTKSFNPRTRVGCDLSKKSSSTVTPEFQSTHPRGVRRGKPARQARAGRVSIHAPAWGATFWGCKKPRCIPWFQSTHSRGVRLRVLVRAYSIQPFQSTHPRGVRP